MTSARSVGILGGTFDPIHFGHLDAAEAARTRLHLDEIRLVPLHQPPHRHQPPMASAFHRFALAALAIEGLPGYRVSDLELTRSGQSYTIDTLRAMHAEGWSPRQIFFILGADAFAEIATWREFPSVLDAAHFVVIARQGTALREAVACTPAVQSRLLPPGSSRPDTGNTRVILIDAATREVSSTLIRERLRARQHIDDLVPPGVARHILIHHLYGAVDGLHGD